MDHVDVIVFCVEHCRIWAVVRHLQRPNLIEIVYESIECKKAEVSQLCEKIHKECLM